MKCENCGTIYPPYPLCDECYDLIGSEMDAANNVVTLPRTEHAALLASRNAWVESAVALRSVVDSLHAAYCLGRCGSGHTPLCREARAALDAVAREEDET